MDDEQGSHKGAVPQREKEIKPREARKKQEGEEGRRSTPRLSSWPRRGSRVCASAASPNGPTSNRIARRTEQHRKARDGVGRLPPEDAVVNRRHRRRREAQREAVEGAVMEPAPPRQAHLQVGRGNPPRCRGDDGGSTSLERRAEVSATFPPPLPRQNRAPEMPNAIKTNNETRLKRVTIAPVAIRVEIAEPSEATPPVDVTSSTTSTDSTRAKAHRPVRTALPRNARPQEGRRGVRLGRARSRLCEQHRHVDAEFVRRRELAGVQALAAVVAEARQIGRDPRNRTSAVSRAQEKQDRTARNSGTRCRRSARAARGRRDHPAAWRAASVPARRPKTVPIVIRNQRDTPSAARSRPSPRLRRTRWAQDGRPT